MVDDRSERLRQRRKRSTEATDEKTTAGESEASKSSKLDELSQPSGSENGEPDEQEAVSIKEEQIGTYMYLPESQTKEMRRLYNVLKAEYEFEFDEEFEKNRHFYPLVVQYGLDGLDGLDALEIRERLEQLG